MAETGSMVGNLRGLTWSKRLASRRAVTLLVGAPVPPRLAGLIANVCKPSHQILGPSYNTRRAA